MWPCCRWRPSPWRRRSLLALALAPGIDRNKEERQRAQAKALARQRAQHEAQLRVEQRPRFGRGAAAGSDVAKRTTLLGDAQEAIKVDARRRVAAGSLRGPIREVECEPYPRTLEGRGAHLDASSEKGRYACLAATNNPYRLLIDFSTGRYALCKISGRPGEGAIGGQPVITVPPACGRI